jgi:hypothetical protein
MCIVQSMRMNCSETNIIDNSRKICELFEDWDMYLTIYKEDPSWALDISVDTSVDTNKPIYHTNTE